MVGCCQHREKRLALTVRKSLVGIGGAWVSRRAGLQIITRPFWRLGVRDDVGPSTPGRHGAIHLCRTRCRYTGKAKGREKRGRPSLCRWYDHISQWRFDEGSTWEFRRILRDSIGASPLAPAAAIVVIDIPDRSTELILRLSFRLQ